MLEQLRGALVRRAALGRSSSSTPDTLSEPPVVAQLMIEIRADGSRTIARGAMNDLRTGASAQVQAEGHTPGEMILSLASSLLALPSTVLRHVRTEMAAEVLTGEASDQPKPEHGG